MNKYLLATASVLFVVPALAADIPAKPLIYTKGPPAPISAWTGLYAGINGGYGVGRDPFNQVLSSVPPASSVSSSIDSRVSPQGGLFGGQIGYNVQTGHIVYGLEGDIQWTHQNDRAGCGVACITEGQIVTIIDGSAEHRLNWFGTARGRLGWTNDDSLLYITGGGAWAGVGATTAFSESGSSSGFTEAVSETSSFTKRGWVLGGGAEVRIAGPWTAKVEYLYMDLGRISDTLFIPAPAGPDTLITNSSIHDHIVRAGLNYMFDWAGASYLPVKAPIYIKAPSVPIYLWNGFYAGINGGYSLGRDPFNQVLNSFAPPAVVLSSIDSRVSPQGGLFGGQIGTNVQTGHIVYGLEGDIQWTSQHDTAGCGLECERSVETLGSAEQRIKWFATARGRLGWADHDSLLYVTGGGALAAISATTDYSAAGPLAGAFSETSSFTKTGWALGGGAETRIAGAWTAKVEYLYMDLGRISDTLSVPAPLGPLTLTTNSSIHDHVIRAGLNYRLDWGSPLVARY